jgi:hypothetical protein
LAAVTHPTCDQPSSGRTRRAGVPITSAISPSNASNSVPAGRSTLPQPANDEDGFRK